MWYALHRLRAEQEQAADDAVVTAGVVPADYVRHLVEIARLGQTEALLAGAGAHNTLAARAASILDEKRRRHVQNRRMVLASVAAIVATAIPLAALQANKKVYKISDEGITAPALLVKQEPKYTEEARDAKIQGTVVVTAIVEVDGRLANIEIKESLDPGLDQNAIAALSNWVFKPAEKDGAPVRVSCTIEVNFRLV
jgi:TonB family protein